MFASARLVRQLTVLLLVGCLAAISTAGTFVVESRRDVARVKRQLRAAQFLQRATFGPNKEEIEALADRMGQVGLRRACEEWIDNQMAMPPQYHHPLTMEMYHDDGYNGNEDFVWIQRYRWHSFYDRAIRADDQLRQRVAWALIQILVTSEDGAGFNDRNFGDNSTDAANPRNSVPRWLGPTKYYDLMVEHAFGKYRDLLEDVTYSPIMGVFLSHMRNRKTNLAENRFPDENYAREIMQLFSIGLYMLHQDGRLKVDEQGELIPTYDNEVIKEYAKVFTGLAFKPNPNATGGGRFWWGNDFEYPMEMFNEHHEEGFKTLINGEVIGQAPGIVPDGNAEIAAALDSLMEHENVAPFICRRLIQRLVKSNPSRAYLRRVTRKFNNNGEGVKGDLAAVVKAILLDPEAWRGTRLVSRRTPNRVEVLVRGTEYSSLTEPIIRFTRLLRGTHATSDYLDGRMMVTPLEWVWIQEAYRQPSVFSFFLPDYQPPGDLVGHLPSRRIPNGFLTAPEFQLKTAVTSNQLINYYGWVIHSERAEFYAGDPRYFECNVSLNLAYEKTLAGQNSLPRLIDHLDLVFCAGTLPQDFKDLMVQVINEETAWVPGNPTWGHEYENWRTQTALRTVICSPFSAISQ